VLLGRTCSYKEAGFAPAFIFSHVEKRGTQPALPTKKMCGTQPALSEVEGRPRVYRDNAIQAAVILSEGGLPRVYRGPQHACLLRAGVVVRGKPESKDPYTSQTAPSARRHFGIGLTALECYLANVWHTRPRVCRFMQI
jgi:hypothetical protein